MAKEPRRYIFPSKLAAKMKKVDMRTQLEASMMSMTLMLVGLCLIALHITIYGGQSWIFKGMLIFNMLCGVVLMGSGIVTSYQQYVFHLEQMGIDPDAEKERVRAQGNIFKRIRMAMKLAKAHRKLIKAENAKAKILASISDGKQPQSNAESIKDPTPTQSIQVKEVTKVEPQKAVIIEKKQPPQPKQPNLKKIMDEERKFLESQ